MIEFNPMFGGFECNHCACTFNAPPEHCPRCGPDKIAPNAKESGVLPNAALVTDSAGPTNRDEWGWLKALYPPIIVLEFPRPRWDCVEIDFWWCPLKSTELNALLCHVLVHSDWLPTRIRWRGFGPDVEYLDIEFVRHREAVWKPTMP